MDQGKECPHCLTHFAVSDKDHYFGRPIICPWCGWSPAEEELYNYEGGAQNG